MRYVLLLTLLAACSATTESSPHQSPAELVTQADELAREVLDLMASSDATAADIEAALTGRIHPAAVLGISASEYQVMQTRLESLAADIRAELPDIEPAPAPELSEATRAIQAYRDARRHRILHDRPVCSRHYGKCLLAVGTGAALMGSAGLVAMGAGGYYCLCSECSGGWVDNAC